MLPRWLSGRNSKEWRRLWFNPWVGDIPWRRKWQITPVFLPGKSHGWRSLVGCSPWGHKSQTRLSDFTFPFHFHALEKEMAIHSSVLTWRISRTVEPGGLQSMVTRVGHNLDTEHACILQSSASYRFNFLKLLEVLYLNIFYWSCNISTTIVVGLQCSVNFCCIGKWFTYVWKWQPTSVFLLGESHGRDPGRLQSKGSQNVRYDWSDFMHFYAKHFD